MSDKDTGENLVKAWAEEQQKLLTNWLDTVRKFGGKPTVELWTKTVDTWQSAVKETIDAQAQWTHDWSDKLANAKGTPEELRKLSQQGQEQLKHWADAERDLWQGWFNVAREINFRPEPGAGAQAGKDLLQLLQESAHKMIDMQASLVRRWTEGGNRPRQEG